MARVCVQDSSSFVFMGMSEQACQEMGAAFPALLSLPPACGGGSVVRREQARNTHSNGDICEWRLPGSTQAHRDLPPPPPDHPSGAID